MIYADHNHNHNRVFEMFSYLTKFFLKNTELNLRDSQEKLLLDIAENKLLALSRSIYFPMFTKKVQHCLFRVSARKVLNIIRS